MTAAAAPSRFSDAELDDIRQREPVSSVFERLGLSVKRAGRMHVCLCPFHAERTASCQLNDAKGVFHCKGCDEGGDVFDAVMKLRGCKFPEAVEWLGGVRELTQEDRDRIEAHRRAVEARAAEDARRAAEKATRLWSAGLRIQGTHAHAYLEARGVNPPAAADLRFVPQLAYYGWADAETAEPTKLGTFPAMLGAIRNGAGDLIGVHRTFLDPREPAKLRPPGDPRRNKPKKILGEQRGGSIMLTPPSARMAYGEGIETVLAWGVLYGATAKGFGLAALVSLGNICGGAIENRPHPFKRHPNGRPILIPEPVPDFSKPGFVPGAGVREAVLLGDGDSDDAGTRARLLTAGRRWETDPARTARLAASVSMAPADEDWSDVLARTAEEL